MKSRGEGGRLTTSFVFAGHRTQYASSDFGIRRLELADSLVPGITESVMFACGGGPPDPSRPAHRRI